MVVMSTCLLLTSLFFAGEQEEIKTGEKIQSRVTKYTCSFFFVTVTAD
jgi:hypothetical protein